VKKIIAISILFMLSIATMGETKGPESLNEFSKKLVAAMTKEDWPAFRKLAVGTLVIEEHWQAYDDNFVDNIKGQYGSLGWHAQKLVEYRTVIANSPKIPRDHERLFKAYCGLLRSAKNRIPSDKEWLMISGNYGRARADSFDIAAPHFRAIVASNMDLVMEVVQTSNGWRVQRLIVSGH